jgi:hypothetical protein
VAPDDVQQLDACASSGLPVTFALAAGAVNCSLSGNQVAATAVPASCVVVASQSGDAQFAPAPSVSASYQVDPQAVAASWGGPAPGTHVSLTAGLTVSVVTTAQGSYQLSDVALISADQRVCGSADAGAVSGNGTTTTSVVIPLSAPGLCTLTLSVVGSTGTSVSVPGSVSYHITP